MYDTLALIMVWGYEIFSFVSECFLLGCFLVGCVSDSFIFIVCVLFVLEFRIMPMVMIVNTNIYLI